MRFLLLPLFLALLVPVARAGIPSQFRNCVPFDDAWALPNQRTVTDGHGNVIRLKKDQLAFRGPNGSVIIQKVSTHEAGWYADSLAMEQQLRRQARAAQANAAARPRAIPVSTARVKTLPEPRRPAIVMPKNPVLLRDTPGGTADGEVPRTLSAGPLIQE